MTEKIIIAGSGGQGVMLLGKVLADAAMRENKFVTWLPAYGAEVRGGTAHCTVIISDSEIGSPCVDKADSLIILNAPSLERFKGRLTGKGLLILNSSMVSEGGGAKATVMYHPFTDIAIGLGNIKVANMVALGCFITKKKIVSAKTVLKVFEDMAPQGKKELIEVNTKALGKGIKLCLQETSL
jgi:2-oxoglutarate ferredoxin oxidoreductase subunit gamma